jgi:hypothetical protein
MARTFHAYFLLPLMARWVSFIFYLVVIVNVHGYVVHCQCSGTAHPIRLQSRALVYGAYLYVVLHSYKVKPMCWLSTLTNHTAQQLAQKVLEAMIRIE